jgi:hypothetical protein
MEQLKKIDGVKIDHGILPDDAEIKNTETDQNQTQTSKNGEQCCKLHNTQKRGQGGTSKGKFGSK